MKFKMNILMTINPSSRHILNIIDAL